MNDPIKITVPPPPPPTGTARTPEVIGVKDALSILNNAGKQVISGTLSGVKNRYENGRLSRELAKMISTGNLPDMSALDDLTPEDRTKVLKDMVLHTRATQANEIKALNETIDIQHSEIATLQLNVYEIAQQLNRVIDLLSSQGNTDAL